MKKMASAEEGHPKTSKSYTEVAQKLLKDRFYLTALELHPQLLESGREVKQLRDLLSNPKFESPSQEASLKMSRSGSQTTLDSFDFTRYSEDGERNSEDRIAVLEFELRKAKETICALRKDLTFVTASDCKMQDKTSKMLLNRNLIKPHEQKALNFLINEYLMLHGYKLTSITFADENQNQDFEDWDDVGLNISKPAELVTIYREGMKQTGSNLCSSSCQTDFPVKDEKVERKMSNYAKANESLQEKLRTLQSELDNYREENLKLHKEIETSSHKENKEAIQGGKSSTTGSESPERFELLDKTNSEDNLSNHSVLTDWTKVSDKSEVDSRNDDSRNEDRRNEAEKKEEPRKESALQQEPFIFINKSTEVSEKYRNELLNLCPVKVPVKFENEILENALNQPNNGNNLVQIVSKSMLRIVPNIILNKREEAIPLLISAINLTNETSTRDKLLQQLFNLKKKPSESERALILAGILGVAKYSPESVVENEILPLCWEQLTHKHVERRLLVVESCRVLISYVSAPIRNSLLLSMLQQMLDDKEESVRTEVIKVLSIVIAYCHDSDKYAQCEELAFSCLKDSNESVAKVVRELLFPVLGKWSLEIGRLRSDLVKNFLHKLNDALKNVKEFTSQGNSNSDVILRVLLILKVLLPFLLVYVANKEAVLNKIKEESNFELGEDLLRLCSCLTNPKVFFTSDHDIGTILHEFDAVFEEDRPNWDEVQWLMDTVFPDLLNNLNLIDITQREVFNSFIDLFSAICKVFGKNFTKAKIRPLLQSNLENLETILSSFNQYSPTLNIIPVYLVSVLSFCDPQEASKVLSRFLCALPLLGIPLDCLEISVRGLCQLGMQELVVQSLWDGVVHQRPQVRGVTAGLFVILIGFCNENLLNSKVTPGLVTLANDSDLLVRTATVPALGALVTDCEVRELHDKAYMQLQMFLADPNTQENHALMRQLVVTMGQIVGSCKVGFKQDVILPQLAHICHLTALMTNASRKVDMAVALIEAYSNIIYGQFNSSISSLVLTGLRNLEQTINLNATLSSHRDALNSMIKECECRLDLVQQFSGEIKASLKTTPQNVVNQSVEEMKQRVSKMFNKPSSTTSTSKTSNLAALQGFFKKK